MLNWKHQKESEKMDKISVFLAEDHAVVREGLKHVISSQQDMDVIGEAEDGIEAVKKVKSLRPDVTLLDISMPRLNGLEAIPLIREAVPDCKIVVLSMHKKEAYAHQVLASGGLGYVLKASPSADLVRAIRAVYRGEYFLSPGISQEVITAYIKSRDTNKDAPAYHILSGREQQVLRLTVEGNSISQTADILFLSPKTVERHRANIMKKLNLNNIIDLMKYAIQNGIIDPDLWGK
jgi:two-component system response regulator NreC